MNRGRDGAPATGPGEEFVSPTFVPKKHPPGVQRAMVQLLGQRPDRLYLNFRMRQVMRMLHSTELEGLLYRLDNRVTYLPITNDEFFDEVFGQQVSQYAGGVAVPLTIHGSHAVDEGVGRTTLKWAVNVLDGTQIEVNRLTPPLAPKTYVYTQEAGLSGYVPLEPTNLRFKFPTANAVGVEWIIDSFARPEQDIGVRLAKMISVLDDETLTAIFPSTDEPYATLKNTFEDNDLFVYKASAVLIALALYMDTLPQEQ